MSHPELRWPETFGHGPPSSGRPVALTMFDLRSFDLASMLECSTALRGIGDGAESTESAATAVTSFLFNSLLDGPDGKRALALVRLYKTHIFDDLEPSIRERVIQAAGNDVDLASVPCLTLLGTAGLLPAWNDRKKSEGHQAIPLLSRHRRRICRQFRVR